MDDRGRAHFPDGFRFRGGSVYAEDGGVVGDD